MVTGPSHPLRRRRRLLIVGCGDVGLRVAGQLGPGWRVMALTSDASRRGRLRQAGICPLVGNLDQRASLRRLSGLAAQVLHLAPPPGDGRDDPRTAALLEVLSRRTRPARIVYGSTTGVYGNVGGANLAEHAPLRPATARAARRVAAEARLRAWGRRRGAVSILRIPGIYALDREGGDPRERVRQGRPVLMAGDDVYTNHIHADDLARACVAALFRGAPQRAYNVCDDSSRLTGDHYDLVADLSGLPRPPRLSREDAAARMSPMQLSFLGESRRLRNGRLKQELRVRLRYPDVAEALPKVSPPR